MGQAHLQHRVPGESQGATANVDREGVLGAAEQQAASARGDSALGTESHLHGEAAKAGEVAVGLQHIAKAGAAHLQHVGRVDQAGLLQGFPEGAAEGGARVQGDIVTVDVGVKLEGMFTDAAITIPVGQIDAETQRLLDVTQASLEAGIAAATPDNHVGDIGAAVQAVVEAAGFGVVRELVGHGVGFSPHEELQIPNYGKPKRGKKLSVGLTIAIEPMVNIGTPKTRTLSDKWTVVTADGKRSAHFEHTVAITENGPRILTLPS